MSLLPHGGKLVDRFVKGDRRQEVLERLKALGAKGGGKEVVQGSLPKEKVAAALDPGLVS